MTGMMTLDELRQAVAAGEIDTVVAAQVDMQGRLMGKRFQAEYFVDSAWQEVHCCNYLFATDLEMTTVEGYKSASWESGYGDYTLKPDLGTLRRIPWLAGTALVLCDTYDHHGHDLVPHAPRSILKRQVARLEAMGMRAMMASELEFFLFRDSYEEAQAAAHRGLTPLSAYNADYHVFQTSKEEDVMRAIRKGLQGAGIPVENTKGEADAGQVEVNVRYADALTMADRHAITKNACKEIAWSKGRSITFMAKWNYAAAGNSSHVHQSLWSLDGAPLFLDAAAENGMSQTMRHYVAGLLHNARDMTLFMAPYINSYKRFVKGTFAPTKVVWSLDNRTAGFRVCGAGGKGVRVECRVGGADLNPHLAMAAMLAAGLDGIANRRELGPAFLGDAYGGQGVPEVPTTLREAIDALDRSETMRAALGDEVVDHYLHAARWEQTEYDRRVTDWEVGRGFERA